MPSDLVLAIGLLVLGFIFMGVEVILVPGFGVIGLVGLGALGGGCYVLWQAAGPLAGVLGVVCSLVLSVLMVWSFVRSKRARKLILEQEVSGIATGAERLEPLIGREAEVLSPLRPSGIVGIDGERYDGMLKDGGFMEKGSRARVVGSEHGQIVLEPIESDDTPQ
jgi:membrane-bound serine protease (ClpP class)